jgi:ABC-type uncharacterized transport system fused permease/ATPase subunit
LEEGDVDALYLLLAERLPQAIVISIGRAVLLGHLHDRAIHLEHGVAVVTEPPQRAAVRAL